MTAKVGFTVTSKGKVKDVKIVSSAGYGLDKKAVKAIQVSKFSPALHNGVPVDAYYIQPLIFECDQWDRSAVALAKSQERREMLTQLGDTLQQFGQRIQAQNSGVGAYSENSGSAYASSLDRSPYLVTDFRHWIQSKSGNVIELEDRSLWMVPKSDLDALGILLMWLPVQNVLIKQGQVINSYIMVNTSERSALPVIYLGKEQ